MRTLLRFCALASVVVLVTLAAILYVLLRDPSLGARVALYWLAPLGLNSLQFSKISLARSSLQLNALTFKYQTSQLALSADLDSVNLSYDLGRLPANPLLTISAPGGQIEIQIPQATASFLTQDVRLLATLRKPVILSFADSAITVADSEADLTATTLQVKQGTLLLPPAVLNLKSFNLRPTRSLIEGLVKVTQGDATILSTRFDRVDLQIPFKFDDALSSAAPATLSADLPGLAIKTGRLKLQLELKAQKSLVLKNLNIPIFGGTLSASPAEFRPPFSTGQLAITLKGIQASQLLKLYQQEQLSADGSLDGSLLVAYNKNAGLSITSGELLANAQGGVIHYQHPEGASLPAQLQGVTDALKNFRYSKLRASISMDVEGLLKIGIQVAGNNPAFQNGKLVNLSVNIDDNLYTLLRSIQLATGKFNSL